MSRAQTFRRVATGARIAVGSVVAAACVVGVVLAIHTPWPAVSHEPAQVEVMPLAGDPVLACTGDLQALGRDSSDPLALRSAGAFDLVAGGTSGDPARTAIAAPDLVDGGEVPRLSDTVDGRAAPLIAGAESITASASDLAGFAAAPCGEARLESWLVGGSVATGTKDLIVLTNASSVTSTVTLSVHGESRSNRTLVIPARTQTTLPLSSIAAGNTSPVVEVVAQGAPVRAVLQSSFVRTLDPAGIDLQDAVAAPQRSVVVPGVQVFDGEGDDADLTVLRLLAPDDEGSAAVTVRRVGSSAAAQEFTVPLSADVPTDVSLRDLAAGSYTVDVVSEVPVVAGVRQQNGFGAGSDFAWNTPASEIASEALFAVPEGPAARVQLVNRGDADATVELAAVGAEDGEQVTVPTGGSIDVVVEAGTVYRLTTKGAVHAGVVMSGTAALATWPIAPSAGAEGSITVYP